MEQRKYKPLSECDIRKSKEFKNWFEIPECEPDRVISHIMTNGRQVPIGREVLAKDVTCPMCSGSKGFYIPHLKTWSCIETPCIQTNGRQGRVIAPPITKRQPEPLYCFGVPPAYHDVDFRLCNQSETIKSNILEYANNPIGFMLFAGTAGTGKTYSACCCMSLYVKGFGLDGWFYSATSLYMDWLGCRQGRSNEIDLIEKLLRKKFLIIDDIGVKPPTDGFMEFVYMLMNKRSEDVSLGTLITTNLTSVEIADKFGQAILSRMASGKIVRFDGKDRRILNF